MEPVGELDQGGVPPLALIRDQRERFAWHAPQPDRRSGDPISFGRASSGLVRHRAARPVRRLPQ